MEKEVLMSGYVCIYSSSLDVGRERGIDRPKNTSSVYDAVVNLENAICISLPRKRGLFLKVYARTARGSLGRLRLSP